MIPRFVHEPIVLFIIHNYFCLSDHNFNYFRLQVKTIFFQSPYNVIRYTLNEESREYFMVDEYSGDVSVKKPLSADETNEDRYNVCYDHIKPNYQMRNS